MHPKRSESKAHGSMKLHGLPEDLYGRGATSQIPKTVEDRGTSMSADNKALVRRYYEEVLGNKNLALVDESVSATFVYHDPSTPEVRGPQAEPMARWTQSTIRCRITCMCLAPGRAGVGTITGARPALSPAPVCAGTDCRHFGIWSGNAPGSKRATSCGPNWMRPLSPASGSVPTR